MLRIALAAAACLCAAACSASELLQNGSFETGTMSVTWVGAPGMTASSADNWDLFAQGPPSSGIIQSWREVGTWLPPIDGNYYLRLQSSFGSDCSVGIRQVFAPQTAPVRFDVWVYAYFDNQLAAVGFGSGSQMELRALGTTHERWEHIAVTSTLPNVDSVVIWMRDGGGNMIVDAASAQVVPEPSLAAAMLVGLVGVLPRARRA